MEAAAQAVGDLVVALPFELPDGDAAKVVVAKAVEPRRQSSSRTTAVSGAGSRADGECEGVAVVQSTAERFGRRRLCAPLVAPLIDGFLTGDGGEQTPEVIPAG